MTPERLEEIRITYYTMKKFWKETTIPNKTRKDVIELLKLIDSQQERIKEMRLALIGAEPYVKAHYGGSTAAKETYERIRKVLDETNT